MRRWLKPWIWILVGLLVLGGVSAAFCWRLMNTSNIWQAFTVGDIPAPRGFVRDTVPPQSYQAYLRALPLKPKGTPLCLFGGQKAKHQILAAAVVDHPLLNRYEQCADVIFRLRAEYLLGMGMYDELCYTDVNDSLLCFVPDSVPADSMQAYFEKYITHVFSWCNTTSLFRETLPRPFVDVRAGDILVHPAQKDENYGHAILIADVAHSPSGRVAVLCLEGNTPAREKHIVRNINLLRNPWFIIDSGDTQIRFIKSRFHSGQLRHYSTP